MLGSATSRGAAAGRLRGGDPASTLDLIWVMPAKGGRAKMSELALIERIAARARRRAGTELGIGDDAALLSVGGTAVVTQDLLVEGVHFDRATSSARDLGHKALAVNLSDLAAMAAEPVAAFVGLCLPPGVAARRRRRALRRDGGARRAPRPDRRRGRPQLRPGAGAGRHGGRPRVARPAGAAALGGPARRRPLRHRRARRLGGRPAAAGAAGAGRRRARRGRRRACGRRTCGPSRGSRRAGRWRAPGPRR